MRMFFILFVLPSLVWAETNQVDACASLRPDLKYYCAAIILHSSRPCDKVYDTETQEQCYKTVENRDWFCSQVNDTDQRRQCRVAALIDIE